MIVLELLAPVLAVAQRLVKAFNEKMIELHVPPNLQARARRQMYTVEIRPEHPNSLSTGTSSYGSFPHTYCAIRALSAAAQRQAKGMQTFVDFAFVYVPENVVPEENTVEDGPQLIYRDEEPPVVLTMVENKVSGALSRYANSPVTHF